MSTYCANNNILKNLFCTIKDLFSFWSYFLDKIHDKFYKNQPNATKLQWTSNRQPTTLAKDHSFSPIPLSERIKNHKLCKNWSELCDFYSSEEKKTISCFCLYWCVFILERDGGKLDQWREPRAIRSREVAWFFFKLMFLIWMKRVCRPGNSEYNANSHFFN